MNEERSNLLSDIITEVARCLELQNEYDSIPEGAFGSRMIRMSIDNVKEAIRSGDLVAMLEAYKDLQSIE